MQEETRAAGWGGRGLGADRRVCEERHGACAVRPWGAGASWSPPTPTPPPPRLSPPRARLRGRGLLSLEAGAEQRQVWTPEGCDVLPDLSPSVPRALTQTCTCSASGQHRAPVKATGETGRGQFRSVTPTCQHRWQQAGRWGRAGSRQRGSVRAPPTLEAENILTAVTHQFHLPQTDPWFLHAVHVTMAHVGRASFCPIPSPVNMALRMAARTWASASQRGLGSNPDPAVY